MGFARVFHGIGAWRSPNCRAVVSFLLYNAPAQLPASPWQALAKEKPCFA